MGADELEALILDGSVTKASHLSDNYYQVYARESVRMDKAFNVYAERKVFINNRSDGQRRFSLTVISSKVIHGVVKHFYDLLSNSLIEAVNDQMRTASSNPFDEYLGYNSSKWDDLRRGMAMTAFRLASTTDPERAGTASARYKNKKVAPRGSFNQFRENSGGFLLIHWKISWSVDRSTGSVFRPHTKIGSYSWVFEDDSRYANYCFQVNVWKRANSQTHGLGVTIGNNGDT